MSSLGRSKVWRYYKIDSKNLTRAVCKLCSRSLGRGGSNSRNRGTSNLLHHLKARHPAKFEKIKALEQQEQDEMKDVEKDSKDVGVNAGDIF